MIAFYVIINCNYMFLVMLSTIFNLPLSIVSFTIQVFSQSLGTLISGWPLEGIRIPKMTIV